MRNTRDENIAEHSQQAATIAHALALIKNRYYSGNVDEKSILAKAVYHEAAEVITGDIATPIKYFNPQIKTAYKDIENIATQKLFDMLPGELKEDYEELLFLKDDEEKQIVKAADKLCAYIKCVEELKCGNGEFLKAKEKIESELHGLNAPEVAYFMRVFIPSFSLTLDELN